MPKPKRKLTRAEKEAKARRRAEFMTIFINGKQKQVRRPQLVEGLSVEEFIANNADPIWLKQNEMWEELDALELARDEEEDGCESDHHSVHDEDEVPF
jgi:hypothetical protein